MAINLAPVTDSSRMRTARGGNPCKILIADSSLTAGHRLKESIFWVISRGKVLAARSAMAIMPARGLFLDLISQPVLLCFELVPSRFQIGLTGLHKQLKLNHKTRSIVEVQE